MLARVYLDPEMPQRELRLLMRARGIQARLLFVSSLIGTGIFACSLAESENSNDDGLGGTETGGSAMDGSGGNLLREILSANIP